VSKQLGQIFTPCGLATSWGTLSDSINKKLDLDTLEYPPIDQVMMKSIFCRFLANFLNAFGHFDGQNYFFPIGCSL
jgi:hypothetical protein